MKSSAAEPTQTSTPASRYAADLAAGRINEDAAQRAVVAALERVYTEIAQNPGVQRRSLIDRLTRRDVPTWYPVRGIYLWGRVGRGKTYLVDTFYDCLPLTQKTRIHFHHFMRRTHAALNSHHDKVDPLKLIAADWAAQHRVVCLDEFHVSDITDAMLLANLLTNLLEAGVTLIATSNEAPADLYAGGLQRERFLPAIALLERELDVLELAGAHDYRLRALEQAPVYYCGEAGAFVADLEQRFTAIAPESGTRDVDLAIEGRAIATVRAADGVSWFTFDTLCGGPRSTADYIEIARLCHTVVLSDVPVLGTDDSDAARRFINLIDELYDRNVNLVMSAAAEPESLYTGQRLAKPFRRTASRLHEMRSRDYFARPHSSD